MPYIPSSHATVSSHFVRFVWSTKWYKPLIYILYYPSQKNCKRVSIFSIVTFFCNSNWMGSLVQRLIGHSRSDWCVVTLGFRAKGLTPTFPDQLVDKDLRENILREIIVKKLFTLLLITCRNVRTYYWRQFYFNLLEL